MTEFRSKWRDFVPRKHTYPTDKTDKRSAAVPKRVMYLTDKTDKRSAAVPKRVMYLTDKTDKRSAAVLEQAMYPTDKTDKRSSQGPPVAVHTEKWITRNLTPKEQAAEAKAYETRGWVAIYSGVLGEPIILARDEEAAKAAPAGFVVYTEAEVALLLTATPDELRQVHEAKKFCGGRVVERRQTEEEEKTA